MASLCRAGYLQRQNAGLHFARFLGCAGGAGQFESCGDFHFELRGFALHDGNVGESGDSNVSFADGNECLHVREKTHLFGYGRSGGLPSGPPDVGDLPWYECRFDGGLSTIGGAGGDEAGADSNVGVVAGNRKRKPHAARRWNRETEGSATGSNAEWKAGVERDGEVRWPSENSRVRSIIQFERQALPFLTGVENGHAGRQRNFGRPLMKDFSLQLHRTLNRFVRDAELQVRALHGVRNGRRVRFPGWLARKFDEPVVFVEGKRDVTRSWYGRQSDIICGGRKTGENQHPCQDYYEYLFHLPPAFFSC